MIRMPSALLLTETVLAIVSMTMAVAHPSVFVNAQTAQNTAEIVRKASPAIVVIGGIEDEGRAIGTGFLVSSDGKIVTALHVIANMRTVSVRLASGEVYDVVSVLAFDERRDLAIIKISGFALPTLELANSNEISAGDSVILIGTAKGLEGSVTVGVISAIREMEGVRLIQTDAATNPGNSGGPLLSALGKVVGVIDFKWRGAENLNFAIASNYARGMLNNLQPPVSLDEMRSRLGGSKDVFQPEKNMRFPPRWKSLVSGTTRILRFEGDYIYGEWVVPQEAAKWGVFGAYELRKQGEKYFGAYRERRVWPEKGYSCLIEFSMELSSVGPTRIEGRTLAPPSRAKLDWKKCTFSLPNEWHPFVWIPEI